MTTEPTTAATTPTVPTVPTVQTVPTQPDTTSPSPTLADPADGRFINIGTPTFSGTAGSDTGDSAIVSVFILDSDGRPAGGSPLQAQRDGGRFTIAVADTPALTDGPYTAHVEQTDDAGNTGRSSEITFTVDTTAPVVTLSCPIKLPYCLGTASELDQSVTVTTTDEGPVSGPPVPGASTTQTVKVESDHTFTVTPDTPNAADDRYEVVASQTDAAGNIGRSKPQSF